MQNQFTFIKERQQGKARILFFHRYDLQHLIQVPFNHLYNAFLLRKIRLHLGFPSSLINWSIKWTMLKNISSEHRLIVNQRASSEEYPESQTKKVILNQYQISSMAAFSNTSDPNSHNLVNRTKMCPLNLAGTWKTLVVLTVF